MRRSERVLAGLGALSGLFITGWVSQAWLGSTEQVPLLIAPMGASTVLLFGAPSSPLAQPWPLLGGNVMAALIGVTAASLIHQPLWAAALAVSTTIVVTGLMGCLHPPAGAVALTAVIGGPVIAQAGYRFVLVPVLLNSVLLLMTALVFHKFAGRRYPQVSPPAPAPEPRGKTFSSADVDEVLANSRPRLNLRREELFQLLETLDRMADQKKAPPRSDEPRR